MSNNDVTITWDYSEVEYYPIFDNKNKVIHTIYWKANAVSTTLDSDGNPLQASAYGSALLNTSDLSAFVEFDDLTLENVKAFCIASLGQDNVDSIDAALNAQISEQKAATTLREEVTWT